MRTPANAFTLIELLVVIAIMGVLAAMLLGVVPEVRFRAKAFQTTQRIHNVLDELSKMGQQEGNAPYIIQRDAIREGVYTYAFDINNRPLVGTQGTALDYTKPYHFGFPWQQEDLIAASGAGPLESNTSAIIDPLTAIARIPAGLGSNVLLYQLNPLRTIELLTMAKILPVDDPATPAVNESLVAYKETGSAKRNPQKPWNDAWGNPMVVAYGFYQAPLQANVTLPDRVGAAMSQYQYSRSIYLSIGACGPLVQSPILTTAAAWTEPTPALWDPTIIPSATNYGNVWIQANEVCQDSVKTNAWNGKNDTDPTQNWDRNCFGRPIWKETKVDRKLYKSRTYRSFLTAPLEFK